MAASKIATALRGATTQIRPFPAALALGITAWAIYVWASWPWFAQGDSAWVLDVARNVASGDGVTTNVTFPAYLAASRGAPIDQNPWFIYPPGYPLLLGGVVKVAGASETSALMLHGVFFIGLLVLTYVVALRFLDPGASALVIALLALQPRLLELSAIHFSADLPFAVLLLGATGMILRASEARTTYGLAAGAALVAAAQMFRFNAATLVPAFAALIWMQGGRPQAFRNVATFLAAWTICAFVLLQLSQAVATAPTFSAGLLLIDTPGYPGLSVEGDPNMPPLAVVLQQQIGGILAKAVAGLRFYLEHFASIGHPLVTGGVVLAGLLLIGLRSARPFVSFVGLATATTIVLVSFIAFDTRYLLFALPSYVLLVIWALRTLTLDFRIAGTVLLALALVVYVGETARLARDGQERAELANEFRALAAYIRETDAPGDWTASDVHHMVAWHAGVPSIRLPNRLDELADVARLRQPVTRLVLTNLQITPTRRNYPDDRWLQALNGAPLPGFWLERTFEGEVLRAVVLRANGSSPGR